MATAVVSRPEAAKAIRRGLIWEAQERRHRLLSFGLGNVYTSVRVSRESWRQSGWEPSRNTNSSSSGGEQSAKVDVVSIEH